MRMVLADVLRLGAAGIVIAAPLWAVTGGCSRRSYSA